MAVHTPPIPFHFLPSRLLAVLFACATALTFGLSIDRSLFSSTIAAGAVAGVADVLTGALAVSTGSGPYSDSTISLVFASIVPFMTFLFCPIGLFAK